MKAQELSMTEWDDIESVVTNKGKEHTGEFFLSKHGYLLCEEANGNEIKIPISDINYTNHK